MTKWDEDPLARAKQIAVEYAQGFEKGWPAPKHCDMPDGCLPCQYCGKMCMSAEVIREGDWYGRGPVVRISSMCDECDEIAVDGMGWTQDFSRTEYAPADEAVAEWNELMGWLKSKGVGE